MFILMSLKGVRCGGGHGGACGGTQLPAIGGGGGGGGGPANLDGVGAFSSLNFVRRALFIARRLENLRPLVSGKSNLYL